MYIQQIRFVELKFFQVYFIHGLEMELSVLKYPLLYFDGNRSGGFAHYVNKLPQKHTLTVLPLPGTLEGSLFKQRGLRQPE